MFISHNYDMRETFTTVNIHKLINKPIHTNIPNSITKLIPNHIKERNAYTTSIQNQLKTDVPQRDVFSLIFFNIYTSDLPLRHKHLITYADDITITVTNNNNTQTATVLNNRPFYLAEEER